MINERGAQIGDARGEAGPGGELAKAPLPAAAPAPRGIQGSRARSRRLRKRRPSNGRTGSAGKSGRHGAARARKRAAARPYDEDVSAGIAGRRGNAPRSTRNR